MSQQLRAVHLAQGPGQPPGQAFEEAPRHKPYFQHADYGIRGSPAPSAVPAQSASRLLPRLSQSPNTLPRYWGTDEEESPLLKGERVNER
ncbi:hypothetical protein ABGA94_09825 [Stenotrophomonas sp. 3diitr2024]